MTIPKQSIRHIPIDHLLAHADNVRESVGDITDLAASIREHGILQPLVVTEHPTELDRWLLLGGHRRTAAARLAGLTHVPCVIRHGLDDDQAEQVIVMLVENVQRRDLGPVEKAEAFGALRRQGLRTVEIARRVGLSEAAISYYLGLLDLAPADLEKVRAGEIASTHAIDVVRTHRQAQRVARGGKSMGRPAVVEGAWLNGSHKLAKRVRRACDHHARPKVGGVGCGQCWETVIRADTVPNQTPALEGAPA